METNSNYLFCLSLFFLISCGSKQPNQKETPSDAISENQVVLSEAQFLNADIVSGVPALSYGSQYINVKGQVEAPPQNRVSIASPLGGYVKEIRLHIGDKVKKGETVVILEDLQFIQLQQDYLTAKTKIIQVQAEYDRQEALSKTQASSLKQAELAKTDLDNQKILLKSIAEKLHLIGVDTESLTPENIRASVPVKSPVDGYVTAIYVNRGKYVSGAETIMELVDPSDIHLSLRVFEKDLPFLRIGQNVSAYTNTDPAKKYEAHIVLIGKSVLPDKSVEVHCHFHVIPPELIPGLYMNATIEAESVKSPAIPQEAVMEENGKQFVFIDEGNKHYRLTPIQIIWSERDTAGFAYLTPPAPNSKVVTKNAYALFMQLRNKKE